MTKTSKTDISAVKSRQKKQSKTCHRLNANVIKIRNNQILSYTNARGKVFADKLHYPCDCERENKVYQLIIVSVRRQTLCWAHWMSSQPVSFEE